MPTTLDQASIIDLADHAAMIIRELNHRTRGPHAFTEPAELARFLDALTVTANGLAQLLRQLDCWLRHQHHAARLQADVDTTTHELVTATLASLTHARHATDDLTAALDTAHQHATHIATKTPNRRNTAQPHQGVNFHP